MYLEWGTVVLKVIDMPVYQRRNVYTEDNADLLYVEHTLGVTATYAPGGSPALPSLAAINPDVSRMLKDEDDTSQVLLTNPRGLVKGDSTFFTVPKFAKEKDGPATYRTGPETDAELYRRMMVPRQKLILWAYDRQTGQPVQWLSSPRPGQSVDATVGPLPVQCDVVSAAGEPASIGVFFLVKTWLPPCPTGADRFILSHRWQMTHAQDENHYLTRVIEGVVHFHAGVRELIQQRPDAVRNQFMHPIPLGYKRTVPSVVQSSDGTTIKYTIVDTDPTVVFSAGDSGATSIDLSERITVINPFMA